MSSNEERERHGQGTFVSHGPCEKCGSSDGKALYTNGTSYCFSCSTYFRSTDESVEVSSEYGGLGRVEPGSRSITFLTGEYADIQSRRISAATCKKYGYQIGSSGSSHIANYYSGERELVAQHVRKKDKKFSWIGDAKRCELWGKHLFNGGGRRVTITEGEIDCLTIAQAFDLKWPVVSLPNGAQSAEKYITKAIDWLTTFDEIVLAFDDDKPGKEAVSAVTKLIPPGKLRIMSYEGYKDANELYLAKGSAAVVRCSYAAAEYRPDGIINADSLWDEILNGPDPGISIPFPKLDSMLWGIREKCLYLFTAASGIGKSTFVNELAYHFLTTHNKTIGILALEESKKRTAERFVGIHLGKQIHLSQEGVTESDLKEAFDATLGTGRVWLYDHWGSTDIDVLLGKIRYLAVACKVDILILDHISIIVSGLENEQGGEVKTIDKLMTKLRSLVEETGITVFAVVHIRKANSEGKSFNEGRPITLDDLRGSGSLGQLSDVVISLERNQYDEEQHNVAKLRVLKNRPTGVVGVADSIQFSNDTGRLTPVDEPVLGAVMEDETL